MPLMPDIPRMGNIQPPVKPRTVAAPRMGRSGSVAEGRCMQLVVPILLEDMRLWMTRHMDLRPINCMPPRYDAAGRLIYKGTFQLRQFRDVRYDDFTLRTSLNDWRNETETEIDHLRALGSRGRYLFGQAWVQPGFRLPIVRGAVACVADILACVDMSKEHQTPNFTQGGYSKFVAINWHHMIEMGCDVIIHGETPRSLEVEPPVSKMTPTETLIIQNLFED